MLSGEFSSGSSHGVSLHPPRVSIDDDEENIFPQKGQAKSMCEIRPWVRLVVTKDVGVLKGSRLTFLLISQAAFNQLFNVLVQSWQPS